MCESCGCGQPNNRHGNKKNIVKSDLKAAAKAGDVKSVKKVANNIRGTVAGKIKPKKK